MSYGAYSSSEVKSSLDDNVKAKSNSSSLGDVSGSRGVCGGDGVLMPSSLFRAFLVFLMVIESA